MPQHFEPRRGCRLMKMTRSAVVEHGWPWLIWGARDGVEEPPCDTYSFISHSWLLLIIQVRRPSLTRTCKMSPWQKTFKMTDKQKDECPGRHQTYRFLQRCLAKGLLKNREFPMCPRTSWSALTSCSSNRGARTFSSHDGHNSTHGWSRQLWVLGSMFVHSPGYWFSRFKTLAVLKPLVKAINDWMYTRLECVWNMMK